MHPIITQIGSLYVYSYGLMVAVGFAVATLLAQKHAPEFGLDKNKVVDFMIAMLIGGILGARLLYIILNMKYYTVHPAEVFNLTRGGLVWYGGFISGIIIGVVFVKINKINFWNGADLLAPFMALAQSIGRIGCFLNGCCYGGEVPSDYILSVVFPNETVFRHPAQIYSSIALLILFVILRRWQKARRFYGEIFLAYIMLYSILRFCVEFLRGDNPRILAGLTISQLISVPVFALALLAFIYRYNIWKRRS